MRHGWILLALSLATGCGAHLEPVHGPLSSLAVAQAATSSRVLDALLEKAWAAAGKAPSGEIDDATFLRRASLDLLGRVPTSTEVRSFLADERGDKRTLLVAALLERPEHAQHMARTWERILMGPEVKNRAADRAAMRRWLEGRFAANADRI